MMRRGGQKIRCSTGTLTITILFRQTSSRDAPYFSQFRKTGSILGSAITWECMDQQYLMFWYLNDHSVSLPLLISNSIHFTNETTETWRTFLQTLSGNKGVLLKLTLSMVGVKVGLSVCHHWFRLTHDSWNKSSYYTRETNPLSTNLYLAKRRCPGWWQDDCSFDYGCLQSILLTIRGFSIRGCTPARRSRHPIDEGGNDVDNIKWVSFLMWFFFGR